MDYVFELPPHLTPVEKTTLLALQARGRMGEYERRRRRRLPVELQRSLGVTHRYNPPKPKHETISPPNGVTPSATTELLGIYGAPLHQAQTYTEVPMPAPNMYKGPQHQDQSGASNPNSGAYSTPDTQDVNLPELFDFNEQFPDMTSLQGMDWVRIANMKNSFKKLTYLPGRSR